MHKQSNAIANIIYEYALTYDITKPKQPSNQHALNGFEYIKKKITQAVVQHLPIQFALVGFPYKSQNTVDKVVSPHADGAETYSLNYLNSLLTKIKNIYPPGAQMTIFTDGLAFADIEGVPDTAVLSYEADIKKMASPLSGITIKGLSDLIPNSAPAQARAHLMTYQPSLQTFIHQYTTDHTLKQSVEHLASWLALEFNHPACPPQVKQQSIQNIAQQLIHRGLQYSAFLQPFRPAHVIRLSVTYQPDVSQKMGCKLSPSSSITPWHGILVSDAQGNLSLKHRSELTAQDTYLAVYSPNRR